MQNHNFLTNQKFLIKFVYKTTCQEYWNKPRGHAHNVTIPSAVPRLEYSLQYVNEYTTQLNWNRRRQWNTAKGASLLSN